MMRGGHLDVCVLGAFQVSASGDLANWHTGAPDAIPAVGGAMDLAIGAKQVFVMMTPVRQGRHARSWCPTCTYPLTGVGCVNRVYTDLAVFDISADGVRGPRDVRDVVRRARRAARRAPERNIRGVVTSRRRVLTAQPRNDLTLGERCAAPAGSRPGAARLPPKLSKASLA